MSWIHSGGVAHQIVLAMFGPQHRRHLLEVGGVATFLGTGGETDRDDPLCDVDQVHLIVLLHGLNHTLTPGGAEGSERCLSGAFVSQREGSFMVELNISRPHSLGSNFGAEHPALLEQNTEVLISKERVCTTTTLL